LRIFTNDEGTPTSQQQAESLVDEPIESPSPSSTLVSDHISVRTYCDTSPTVIAADKPAMYYVNYVEQAESEAERRYDRNVPDDTTGLSENSSFCSERFSYHTENSSDNDNDQLAPNVRPGQPSSEESGLSAKHQELAWSVTSAVLSLAKQFPNNPFVLSMEGEGISVRIDSQCPDYLRATFAGAKPGPSNQAVHPPTEWASP
jgi:hypothetical protein